MGNIIKGVIALGILMALVIPNVTAEKGPIKKAPATYTDEERAELDKLKKKQAVVDEKEMDRKALDIARRDLFKDYIVKKKKVLSAYWRNEKQLQISMFNNGHDRSGYADYICVESKTWGKDEKLMFKNDFTIYIYDAVQLSRDNFVHMGEYTCRH